MTTAEVWILLAAIVAVLLVALVAGYALNKRRRISLTPEAAETQELTDRSGGYTAAGGFSFSQGGKPAPEPVRLQRTDDEGQPHIGDDAAIPRDAAKRTITNVPLPDPEQGPEAAPTKTPQPGPGKAPQSAAGKAPQSATGKSVTPAESTSSAGDAATAATGESTEAESRTAATSTGQPAAATAGESTESGTAAESSEAAATESGLPASSSAESAAADAAAADLAAADAEVAAVEALEAEAAEAGYAAAEVAAAAGAAVAARPAPAEKAAPAEVSGPHEEIDPTTGRLTRLRGRLSRSQNAVGKSLLGLLGGGDLDEDSWEEIEDTLVMADLGTASTAKIVDRLREEMASRSVRTAADARAVLREVLIEALRPELDRSIRALPHDDHPSILLVVGVNGTGKTTTTGKLARVLVADGRRVLLGAADTFRAAAADQLQTWGERVGADTVRGKEAADPASVAFDAVSVGIERGVDVVLIDTAGRLHTKTGLMDELGKVKRVVEKKAKVDEVILVLDATVGQNGLTQARVFAEVVDITGVALTKLDGTAKGGIVFQVQHELGVPIKLVGLGEGADDLAPFEPGAFVDALLG
ncbi:signal recognition particle-docking protein FtsY [Nocardia sp. NPDC020380]|uniref:signal recognition particle-docking protein FtsY n=1 Tax=Nocardia sp. NPDC020380 TaxID=3364309 RepID=UPI0037B68114